MLGRFTLIIHRALLLLCLDLLTCVAALGRELSDRLSIVTYGYRARWQDHLLSGLCTELATELVFEIQRRSVGPLIESGQ